MSDIWGWPTYVKHTFQIQNPSIYTSLNLTSYTFSYFKWLWEMSQYQYARFHIIGCASLFGTVWVSWYPHCAPEGKLSPMLCRHKQLSCVYIKHFVRQCLKQIFFRNIFHSSPIEIKWVLPNGPSHLQSVIDTFGDLWDRILDKYPNIYFWYL